MAGIQSSMNPSQVISSSSTGTTGLLSKFVGPPPAISSSQAASVMMSSNSKSLPNIPTAIGRHLSGSKVRIPSLISFNKTLIVIFYVLSTDSHNPIKILFISVQDLYLNKVGRRSPPAAHTTAGSARSTPHHSAMLVRRSKSSAILPLRKHLIEKTLMEQKAMDEEQLYLQQKEKVGVHIKLKELGD